MFQDGKSATENFQLMKQAYGDNVLSRTRVQGFYARLRDCRENFEDDRSERLTAFRAPDRNSSGNDFN